MLVSIILIIAGLFACYGLIVANMPTIKDEFDKIIPFQGVIGIILICMGLWDLLYFSRILTLLSNNRLL